MTSTVSTSITDITTTPTPESRCQGLINSFGKTLQQLTDPFIATLSESETRTLAAIDATEIQIQTLVSSITADLTCIANSVAAYDRSTIIDNYNNCSALAVFDALELINVIVADLEVLSNSGDECDENVRV